MKLKEVSFNNDTCFRSCSECSPRIGSHVLSPHIVGVDFILTSVTVVPNIILDVQNFLERFSVVGSLCLG